MTRTQTALAALAVALAAGAAGWGLHGAREPVTREGAGSPADADRDADGGGDAEAAHERAMRAVAAKRVASGEIAVTPEQIRIGGIEVQPVSSEQLGGEIVASGRIVPATGSDATVTARTGGTVLRLLRGLGDPVARGTPLAVIDSREVAEARAAYARALGAEALAKTTLDREDRLFREKVTAAADYQQARAAYATARIETGVTRQAVEALGAAAGARDASRMLTVLSSASGRIIEVAAAPGQTVDAAKPLFRVADQRTVWAELNVPAREIGGVHRGALARVEPQGETHSHTGRVIAVSPSIDPASGAAKAIVSLANPSGELAAGALVTGRISTGAGGPSALVVPRDALQQVDGRTVLFVRTSTGFAIRPVTVAPGTDPRAAVLSGIRPGEAIAVANSFILKAELGKGAGEHD